MYLSMVPHQFAPGYQEHGTMAIPSEGCSGLEAFPLVAHVWCGPVPAIRELPALCKQQFGLARLTVSLHPAEQCWDPEQAAPQPPGISHPSSQPLPAWPLPESAAQRAEQTLGLVHS